MYILTLFIVTGLIPNDPWYHDPYNGQWYLQDFPDVWDITTGDPSIIIAVIDTGVLGNHEDLVDNLVPGWNVYSNNSDTSDQTGHGTLVTGQIGARGNNGIGCASPAWYCKLMPIVAVTPSGASNSDLQAEALSWAANHGARVANISFSYMYIDTLSEAAENFVQQTNGIVVMSMGNFSVCSIWDNDPNIIAVAALDRNNEPINSGCGDAVDLCAPGISIMTTNKRGTYSLGSGTSAASAFVSGVAALILSVNPCLTGEQVTQILFNSADDLGDPGWDKYYGHGKVNAKRALEMATAVQIPAVTGKGLIVFCLLLIVCGYRCIRK